MGGRDAFISDTATGKAHPLLCTINVHVPINNPDETHWPCTKDVTVKRGLAGKRMEMIRAGRNIKKGIEVMSEMHHVHILKMSSLNPLV